MTESEGEAIRRAWEDWMKLEPWQAELLRRIEQAGPNARFAPRLSMYGKSWVLRHMQAERIKGHSFGQVIIDEMP